MLEWQAALWSNDFKNIMQEHKYWHEDNWSATDSIYTFETGSQIEFFSADQPDKLRGARRDRCFINEANNIKLDAFDQLEVRTKEFIFIDWNPTNSFWFYEEVVGKREDVDHIILTYKDNEALSPEIISSIEQRKNRKGWWQVYGEGQLGEVEGKIYKNWNIVDEVPHEARLERYGMDFGYSNDPTAIVGIYKYNGGYILDEVCFQKGMSNKEIADTLKNIDRALVIADSAEPKSIADLKLNFNVKPQKKGKGSVLAGINKLREYKVFYTQRSKNLATEVKNYQWIMQNGESTNTPIDNFNHCF
jgi:phage terminase large subunit